MELKYGDLPIQAIHPNEPFMVLRGKDMAALPAIRAYLGICFDMDAPEEHLRGIEAVIARFETFRAEYPEFMHVPD